MCSAAESELSWAGGLHRLLCQPVRTACERKENDQLPMKCGHWDRTPPTFQPLRSTPKCWRIFCVCVLWLLLLLCWVGSIALVLRLLISSLWSYPPHRLHLYLYPCQVFSFTPSADDTMRRAMAAHVSGRWRYGCSELAHLRAFDRDSAVASPSGFTRANERPVVSTSAAV